MIIVAIFVYELIYTYKINKMIQAGEVKGRKLVDFYKMVMGAIIVGLVIFSVFLRTGPADSFHPDFLCFVEFSGADDAKYECCAKAAFREITEGTEVFATETIGEISDCLLYIGYLEQGCRFDITMSLLDDNAKMQYDEAMEKANKEDKGNFPAAEEYAVSTGSVSIRIDE